MRLAISFLTPATVSKPWKPLRSAFFFFFFFFKFYFIFKLYIIVLVLPNIKMNTPAFGLSRLLRGLRAFVL